MGIKNLFQPRMKYKLFHFLVADSQYQPLVRSQVFEQAYLQMVIPGINKPKSVAVVFLLHYSDLFNGKFYKLKHELGLEFPNLKIIPIIRTIRLGGFFKWVQLNVILGVGSRTIIHCREESAHYQLKRYIISKKIKTVLDVRGLWPFEYFLHQGYEDIKDLNCAQLIKLRELENFLINQISLASGVSFVTLNLKEYFTKQGIPIEKSIVVPCVTSRVNLRKDGLLFEKNESKSHFWIVYVGTDRSYQNLGDLALPFIKTLMDFDERINLKILSKDILSIKDKLVNLEMDETRVILKSVDRKDVFEEIVDSDLALLLRRVNTVNKVASPVKISEYFSVGLPLLFQKDSIDISDELISKKLGISVDLQNLANWKTECDKVIEFLEGNDKKTIENRVKQYFIDFYNWEYYIPKQREFYTRILIR
jgi:hypothetical protein